MTYLRKCGKKICFISKADTIHIVYDSYIEGSIKDCERVRRAQETEPLEFVNLMSNSPLPVQFNRFWVCSKNKENIQIISRKYFIERAAELNKNIVLSSYVTDAEGIVNSEAILDNNVFSIEELNVDIEEADSRLIPHIFYQSKNATKRVLVSSNDTDVFVLLVHYFAKFSYQGLQELWILFGTGEKSRYIPIHTLISKVGPLITSGLLTAHVLSGCDVTSKVGTKQSALKCINDEMTLFSVHESLSGELASIGEKYLIKVLDNKSESLTFDKYRFEVYYMKNKSIIDLPPTSSTMQGHFKRSFYFIKMNCSLLDFNTFTLKAVDYGWEFDSSVLVPCKLFAKMPDEFTVTCGCEVRCTNRCKCVTMVTSCTEYCKCSSECENKT